VEILEREAAVIGHLVTVRGLQMSRLIVLLRRAKLIIRTEGVIPLIKRGFAFAIWLCFQYRTYYIVEYDLSKDWHEADFLPRIRNFALKIVSSNREADELEASGLEFRSHVINARERLDKGAIAFCIFVGSELAYIAWLAMSQQAKDVLDEPPFRVNFSDNEACWGGHLDNSRV